MSVTQAERRPSTDGCDGVPGAFRGAEISLPEAAVDEVSRLQVRVLEDAMSAGRAASWFRRAEAFEDARPKPGDYVGRATAADLAEQDRRLARDAELCRTHAELLTRHPMPLHEFERAIVAGLIRGEAA